MKTLSLEGNKRGTMTLVVGKGDTVIRHELGRSELCDLAMMLVGRMYSFARRNR